MRLFVGSTLLLGAILGAPSAHAASTPVVAFSTPVNVSNNATRSQAPEMATDDDGVIYVAWEDVVPMFSRSTDGGTTFSPAIRVIDPYPGYEFSQLRLVAVGHGIVHLAFTAFALGSGGAEVFMVSSGDGGSTFGPPFLVSRDDGANSIVAAVAANANGQVDVVWEDTGPFTIAYTHSSDGGSTFSFMRRISNALYGPTYSPDIVTTGSLFAAWNQGNYPDEAVYFTESHDGGTTFSEPAIISRPSQRSWSPRLAVGAGGKIHAVWAERDATGGGRILFARLVEGSSPFYPAIVLAEPVSSGVLLAPRIAVTSTGAIVVTWGVYDYDTESMAVFFTQSLDGGYTFSVPSGGPGWSSIAALGPETIGVVWHENPIGQDYPDVFFSAGLLNQPGEQLKVMKAGAGSGRVRSDPPGIDCGPDCDEYFLESTIVHLDAAADSGSVFNGWSGDPDCVDGVVSLASSATCEATFGLILHGKIRVEPLEVDFADVPVGARSAPRMVTVFNDGQANLAARATMGGGLYGDFEIDPLLDTCSGAVLPPGASCGVGIIFAPRFIGNHFDWLELLSDDPNAPMVTVRLTGDGWQSYLGIPRSLDFDAVTVGGRSLPLAVTIENTNHFQVQIVSVSRSGVDRSSFKIVHDGCEGRTLGPGDTCRLRIRFAPLSAGPKYADLRIDARVHGLRRLGVPMHGSGVPAP